AAGEAEAGSCAAPLDEHLAKAVVPGERRLADVVLDRSEIWAMARAGLGAHHDVQPRMARPGDLCVALDARAGKARERNLLDALAHSVGERARGHVPGRGGD